jgi:5-methyltetrahydropteroyltriglutamate--homocysteine methyltransferase
VRDWGVAALERAAQGVTVTKAVHICYGYGTADVKRWKTANTDWSHYEATLPLLAKSTIDQVSVETAATGVDISVIAALEGKDVLVGVVDVGSETVESAELVADRLRAALKHTSPGHLFACTDCGMMPLSRRATEGKLRALAAGAALVNATM